jgi:hypothetical protein
MVQTIPFPIQVSASSTWSSWPLSKYPIGVDYLESSLNQLLITFSNHKKHNLLPLSMKTLHLFTLFIVATLSVVTLQQSTIYVVQYGTTDTACSDTFRVYTMPIQCTRNQITSLAPYVSGGCFGGTVGNSLLSSSSPYCNSSIVTIISPNANIGEGQCVNRNRYYCSAPPPPTVVPPTSSYLKYNYYLDEQCTLPNWYSSYNETVG